jgi:8-oxo-dGTP pyrophosphatase MutT (NUDIX family)
MINEMTAKIDITYFNTFLSDLRNALSKPLPGAVAHHKMSPPHRPVELQIPKEDDNVRESAVLILLWKNEDQISTVFILRPEYDGIHSNQIAFPGGKYEKTDNDFVATALREAQEEVSINPETISILGQLTPLYISPSQFIVYPIVGYTTTTPTFIPDPVEIQEIIPCNLFSFLNPDFLVIHDIEVGSRILPEIPCYKIKDKYIWGATAMIFSELLEVIKSIV